MTEFVSNRDIYLKVVQQLVPQTKKRLWIATADMKDMYVNQEGRRDMVPFLQVLNEMLRNGIELRLIHAKEPGPAFRADFDKCPGLWEGLERVLCPRVHFKCVIVDGKMAYFGSANLTGAGMGAKSEKRRNFENGVITDDLRLLKPLETQFDDIWRGAFCESCDRRDYCGDCPVSGDL